MNSLRFVLFSALLTSTLQAAPVCTIDSNSRLDENGGLVSLVSGTATGFAAGPIYVTITNSGKSFTTLADKTGKWSQLYVDKDPHTEVLCWQN